MYEKTSNSQLTSATTQTMYARIQKVMSEGAQLCQRFFFFFFFFAFFFFFLLFLVDEGRKDPNTATISGPSPARQRNAIQMAFCWRANDDPTLNAGLEAS